MKTIIPAKTVVTCDFCRRDSGQQNSNDKASFKSEARVAVIANGLDHLGIAVGPGGCSYDLCDGCAGRMMDFLVGFTEQTIPPLVVLTTLCTKLDKAKEALRTIGDGDVFGGQEFARDFAKETLAELEKP